MLLVNVIRRKHTIDRKSVYRSVGVHVHHDATRKMGILTSRGKFSRWKTHTQSYTIFLHHEAVHRHVAEILLLDFIQIRGPNNLLALQKLQRNFMKNKNYANDADTTL